MEKKVLTKRRRKSKSIALMLAPFGILSYIYTFEEDDWKIGSYTFFNLVLFIISLILIMYSSLDVVLFFLILILILNLLIQLSIITDISKRPADFYNKYFNIIDGKRIYNKNDEIIIQELDEKRYRKSKFIASILTILFGEFGYIYTLEDDHFKIIEQWLYLLFALSFIFLLGSIINTLTRINHNRYESYSSPALLLCFIIPSIVVSILIIRFIPLYYILIRPDSYYQNFFFEYEK